jgi:Uma2 family endonuclease
MTQPDQGPGGILASDTRLSIREYADLPDDGKRYEILDGELAVTPAPTTRHQRVSRRIQFALYDALERSGLGEVYDAPVDVVLDEHTVVQPDLAFVWAAHRDRIEEHAIVGPPDMIAEILSPSTRRRDVLVKARLYARFGVDHYWIVDPTIDRIDFYRRDGDQYTLAASVSAPETARPEGFDGVALALAEIFG